MTFPVPNDEAERLQSVAGYGISKGASLGELDDLCRIAAKLSDAPVAYISLIGPREQLFAGRYGLPDRLTKTPRRMAICAHTILHNQPLIVEDLTRDERFLSNPLVRQEPPFRFYCGIPLCNADGHNVGTICVLDHKVRALADDQLSALHSLARQTLAQLELRRANRELAESDARLEAELRRRTRALQEASDEATRAHAEIVKLAEFAREINASTELDDVVSRICDHIRETFGIPDLAIWLADGSGGLRLHHYAFEDLGRFSKQGLKRLRDLRINQDELPPGQWEHFRRRGYAYNRDTANTRNPMIRKITDILDVKSFLNVLLVIGDQVVGMVGFGAQERSLRFSRKDIRSIINFCNQISGGLHTASLLNQIRAERERSERMRLDVEKISQIARTINESSDLDQILGNVFSHLTEEYDLGSMSLLVPDAAGDNLMVYKVSDESSRHFSPEQVRRWIARPIPLKDEPNLFSQVFHRRRAFIASRNARPMAGVDQKLLGMERLNVPASLIVPLVIGEECVGLIAGFTNAEGNRRADLRRVLNFCEQIAGAIYTSNLLHEARASRDRLERAQRIISGELQMARRIQEHLLPLDPVRVAGATIFTTYMALEQIGGDFVDYHVAEDGAVGMLIADASGHGVPAALIGSMSRIVMEPLRDRMREPAAVLRGLNRAIENKLYDNFITACYAVYDPADGSFRYSIAGHPAPMLLRPGEAAIQLEGRGSVLGILSEPKLREYAVQLKPGDRVLLVTDGILECRSHSGEELNNEQLVSLLSGVAAWSAEDSLSQIVAQLRRFMASDEFEDDVTMVLLALDG